MLLSYCILLYRCNQLDFNCKLPPFSVISIVFDVTIIIVCSSQDLVKVNSNMYARFKLPSMVKFSLYLYYMFML